jgi:hypothetical protein
MAYLIFIATDNGFDYVTGFGIYVFGLIGMAEKASELDYVGPIESRPRVRADARTGTSVLGPAQPLPRYPIIGAS